MFSNKRIFPRYKFHKNREMNFIDSFSPLLPWSHAVIVCLFVVVVFGGFWGEGRGVCCGVLNYLLLLFLGFFLIFVLLLLLF